MNRKLANEELGRLDIESFRKEDKNQLIAILDNVRSLNNIGSVFRTADAFAIEAVYLCGITAKPPHREINKTALGATESVNWTYFEDTQTAVKKLKEDGWKVYAIEQTENSILLNEFKPLSDEKIALIFGHEVKGVEQKVINQCDGVIEIPQKGTKHSLNISVSAGVVIWDLVNKLDGI
ncbi:MAG: RNA methyltransferase [Flavobacteriales bacterium]|nr:RNA methyltransferase [Flavobacteriales bacterium]MAC96630.1 RNA methyltransferase [Flavobacteriales bacterium]|tara:strand:+ start:3440 stop:3976 length:537 start_codon:yes stop_codon:yes gene_type:complete